MSGTSIALECHLIFLCQSCMNLFILCSMAMHSMTVRLAASSLYRKKGKTIAITTARRGMYARMIVYKVRRNFNGPKCWML